MRLLLFAAVFACLSSLACGVVLSGVAYDWLTIEPLPSVVVRVFSNSSMVSQKVSDEYGEYSFNLSPGEYTLEAAFFENGSIKYSSFENLSIMGSQESVFFDLVMFPPTEEFFPSIGEDIPELEEEIVPEDLVSETGDHLFLYILVLLALAASASAAYIYFRKKPSAAPRFVGEVKVVSEELYDVVEIIRKRGGMMAQRELQKELGFSAAKTTMVVNQLESRGLIERIKKGRGNIIRLKQS